ncbi:hypothetical protein [Ectobacillus panaciterrae]|nr:hypothetical protein [Ectobacillus panaciterrae]
MKDLTEMLKGVLEGVPSAKRKLTTLRDEVPKNPLIWYSIKGAG